MPMGSYAAGPQPVAQRRHAALDLVQARELAGDLLVADGDVDALGAAFRERAIEHLADALVEGLAGGGDEVGQARLEVVHDLLELGPDGGGGAIDDLLDAALGLGLDL